MVDSLVHAQPAGSEIAASPFPGNRFLSKKDPTKAAYFWLCAFYVVYCSRPEDWIPGLHYVPMARITAILALWGLYNTWGRTKRKVKDLPVESRYLLALILWFFISAVLSPIWPGGAISHNIDFSKVYVAWVMTFLLVTDFKRLKTIIFIQASSVVAISVVSLIKGRNTPRLNGVLSGMYGNPNDLAFCIVLALPFCMAFMLSTKRFVFKLMWLAGMLCMLTALLLTASRAGIIDLAIAGTVALWHFGIRGRRAYLIVAAFAVGAVLMTVAGDKMKERLESLSSGVANQQVDGSYEARRYLMEQAIRGIERYPIFGLGGNCFIPYSGDWHEVHMSYLEIAVEGGIPALILYLLFFRRGFRNLKILRKMKDLDRDEKLFVGALHASLVGFAVGALFAPVAYQFFSYFAVAYTSTLLKIREEQKNPSAEPNARRPLLGEVYVDYARTGAVAPAR